MLPLTGNLLFIWAGVINDNLDAGSVVSSDLLSMSLVNLSTDNATGFISRLIPSMAIRVSPFESSSGAFSFGRVGKKRLNGENISKQNADWLLWMRLAILCLHGSFHAHLCWHWHLPSSSSVIKTPFEVVCHIWQPLGTSIILYDVYNLYRSTNCRYGLQYNRCWDTPKWGRSFVDVFLMSLLKLASHWYQLVWRSNMTCPDLAMTSTMNCSIGCVWSSGKRRTRLAWFCLEYEEVFKSRWPNIAIETKCAHRFVWCCHLITLSLAVWLLPTAINASSMYDWCVVE